MSKTILKDDEVLKKLQSGVNKLNDAVKNSLGPSGLNIILDKDFFPQITSDGVTAVKEVFLKDRVENMGASIVKEASIKTSLEAGDGTTSSVVLANAFINNAIRYILSGANPLLIKKGIKQAEEIVVEKLKKLSKPVQTLEDIFNVAKISCRDEELADKLSKIVHEAGKDVAVAIEDSQVVGITSDVVNGFEIERGFYSPFMATNINRMEAELRDPAIIIFNKRVSRFQEIAPSLDLCLKNNIKDVLIIATDFDQEVIGNCVVNKSKGVGNFVCIKAPMFYNYTREALEDIALFTGAKVIEQGFGLEKEPVFENFGRAGKIIISKDRTTILPQDEDIAKQSERQMAINERVQVINEQIEKAKEEISKEQLKKRITKLLAKAVTIKVGCFSDYEQQELKDRIDDAIRAMKSAMEEGMIIGGGVSFINIIDEIKPDKNQDINWGIEIVKQSLLEPIKQIAYNSGFTPEVIIEKIREKGDKDFGFDFNKGEYVDMLKKGIVDPLKVVRCAFQNAISVASILLTANTAIVIDEESKPLDKIQ